MNNKSIVHLFFLFFSIRMAFCVEEPPRKKRKTGKEQSLLRGSEVITNKALRSLTGLGPRERDEEIEGKRQSVFELSLLGQEEKNTRILQAIIGNDLHKIESLLEAEANPNTRDESGKTLLYYSVFDLYGSVFYNNPFYDRQLHEKCLDKNA